MSRITDICKKNNIQDLSEISHLEAFFQDPDINKELENAEKFRKIRYLVLIPLLGIITIFIFYASANGMYNVEVWKDSGIYRPSEFSDGIVPVFFINFLIISIVIALFRSRIEGAIKDRILTKLSKELYSKLEYNQSKKYAFGDTSLLVSSWLLNEYNEIDKVEDSIAFTIDEPHKHILVQGYELQTSRVTRDRKGRKSRRTTNHCYLLRVMFPEARIELKNDLLIKTDEVNSPSRSALYALFGAFIWFSLWTTIAQDQSLGVILAVIGWIVTFLLRRWYIQRKRVRLENIEFEKYFDVKCEDQIGSRMIITPAFMDRLVKLAKWSPYHYELLYRADRFYIKWSVGSSYLEVNTWKNIRENIGTFISWYAQMKEIVGFVVDMRLMYYSHFSADDTRPDIVPEYGQMESLETTSQKSSFTSWFGISVLPSSSLVWSVLNIGSMLSRFR